MTRHFTHTDLYAATRPAPWAKRPRPLPFIFADVWDRCPECVAKVRADSVLVTGMFDARRDAGLRRRDVNEALEILTLEALAFGRECQA